jgi:phage terminase large subunit
LTPLSLDLPTARVFQPLIQPRRYKGAKGGRGSGKSHFFADQWLDRSISEKIDVVCLREVQKSLDFSVKKLLEHKIAANNVGSYFEVQDKKITSRNGGVTIFQGMQNHTADSIKSLEGFDVAWFEEAQNASENSLTILRPTLRNPNSELWFSWNPKNATDPIECFLVDDPPKDSMVVHANYLDNPFCPDVLLQEAEHDRKRDPEKFAWVWLGQHQRNSERRVFKNWVIEEFERPKGTVFRLGADWGFSVDPSVLVRCDIDGNRLYVDYEAYQIGCEIVNLPELFMSVPEAEKWPSRADSARPETISYMRTHGFPKMQPCVKGSGSVDEGIQFLQSMDIVVHPRCKHLIDELTMYSYKTDPLTNEVLPILEDKNNHVIDALRYACEGARRATKPKPKDERKPRPRVSHGWLGA